MLPVKGYLELYDKGFGFLRCIENNFRPTHSDTYVPANLIRQYNLREGHFVAGLAEATYEGQNKKPQLKKIERVNDLSAEALVKTKELKLRTSISPDERLRMSLGEDDLTGNVLDLIVPVGKGTRGLIISPPKAGKTTILQHIAKAVEVNHPEVEVLVLLVDERPEEVTDFKRSFERVQVLSSSADEDARSHLRITRLTLNAAMRRAESGGDVLVLIDSLTRMGRAFNKETDSFSRTLSGGLGANALDWPRRFFGAARNIEDGGSLTIIASILVDTGSRMDEVIFQEFKGTGNLDLVLSKACAERRLFPAINVNESGTRKEELLLSPDELKQINKLRRLLSEMRETEALAYLLEAIKDKKIALLQQ
ncbi:MAG TPA: transcription termination factor Rho [Caldithrix abyssi]|uniref:Transcription termination factor Rho n=1 Tax=Caldithrix abyssi TaxID=187145 RepID=A0A7V4U0L5_CALAY|nr:transcription termination factor Rho [Caldithrix abyssi]